jgi:hypothetical protein
MSRERFFFPLLFFKDAKLLEALSSLGGLLDFAFLFADFPMLVENLEEVLGDELRRIKLLPSAGEILLVERLGVIMGGRSVLGYCCLRHVGVIASASARVSIRRDEGRAQVHVQVRRRVQGARETDLMMSADDPRRRPGTLPASSLAAHEASLHKGRCLLEPAQPHLTASRFSL